MTIFRCLNFKTNWIKTATIFMSVLLMNIWLIPSSHAGIYPPQSPQTFYVSKNGDNTDGRTWATAWNELDQIHWEQMNAENRDSIILDGGQRRMVYRKTLTVNGTPSHYGNLRISVSAEAGHNGQVVIAPGPNSNGIELNGTSISVDGSKRSGILIWRAKQGVRLVPSGYFSLDVKNVEISRCTEAGVYVAQGYYLTRMMQLLIHDNATNIVAHAGSPGQAQFDKCWIYNNFYRSNSDGVRIDPGQSSAPTPVVRMSNCVIGPGLRDGINNQTGGVPTLLNCLLINATRNNISSPSIYVENVTSFMAKLNPQRLSHSCVKLTPELVGYHPVSSRFERSIFYGGMVEIPDTLNYGGYPQPFHVNVEDNTQFRTTGNTTVLSESMEDPLFRSRVEHIRPRTPIALLKRLDFSLRPNSPALGTGSSVTSVQNLLNSFE